MAAGKLLGQCGNPVSKVNGLLVDEELICEAGMAFSEKSIGGTLVVGPTDLGGFDPASCE